MKYQRYIMITLLSLLMILTSCRSIPIESYPDIMNWFPDDVDLLVKLNVPGNEELAQSTISLLGLHPEDFAPLLKRSAILAAGFTMDERGMSPSQIPFHAVFIGLWPRSVFGTALGEEWKRRRSVKHTWDGPDGLSLAAPTNEEILISRGALDTLISLRGSSQSSRMLSRFPENADLALLVTNPDFITQSMPIALGQIEAISAALHRNQSQYSLEFVIFPKHERLGRAIALALRIGLSARFGTSLDPLERKLFSAIDIQNFSDEVRLLLPPMPIPLLERLARELKIFPKP